MWFRVWLCLIFLTAQYRFQEHGNNGFKLGAPIENVLQNITRANKIIVEFVKNYEKLQKLYKSQESFELSKSESDLEANGKKANEIYATSTTRNDFPGTSKYFMFERNKDSGADTVFLSDDNEEEQAHESSAIKEEITSVAKASISDESKKSENFTSDVEILALQTSTKATLQVSKTSQQIKEDADAQYQVDFHKAREIKTRLKKIYKGKADNKKTRIRVKKIANDLKGTVKPRKQSQDVKVKRVVRAEKFPSQNIWSDIINNKPIKMEDVIDQSDVRNNETNNNNQIKLRLKLKNALMLIARHNKNILNARQNDSESSSKSSEMEALLYKKFNHVRSSSFGIACLKATIRKCYKALKRAIKHGCSKAACKRSFKEMFKQNARTECIAEFDITKSNHKIVKLTNSTKTQKERAVDYVRSGKYHLDEECLPLITGLQPQSKSRPKRNKTPKKTPLHIEKDEDLNLLRGHSKRSCMKASRDKCKRACKNTLKVTCGKRKCNKVLNKYMKKGCKKACNYEYKLGSRSSSDSSEDSGSD